MNKVNTKVVLKLDVEKANWIPQYVVLFTINDVSIDI